MGKKIFINIFLIFFSINVDSKYDIEVNFESNLSLNSQKQLLKKLESLKSKTEIEEILHLQDWIKYFSIQFKPFSNQIYIKVESRKPIFILNGKHFYDKNLKKFNFDSSEDKFIKVTGPISNPKDVLEIIDLVKYSENVLDEIDSIEYSHINGWDIFSGTTQLRFGKEISTKKIDNFQNTINYLYDKTNIPSIIDMRYKDGVALSYAK